MNEIIRLTISEAAQLFGVNSQTIRRAIKNQEITYSVVRGRYQLNFESVLKWSQKKPAIKNKLVKNGIGQYVDKWKIKNPLYSPNPEAIKKKEKKATIKKTASENAPKNAMEKKKKNNALEKNALKDTLFNAPANPLPDTSVRARQTNDSTSQTDNK